MTAPKLMQRWGRFAAAVFLLTGVTLAYLQAGPVAGHGAAQRYAFWLATAGASLASWWASQWLVVPGHDRLGRGLLLRSSLLATVLFVPPSLAIDFLFALPEEEASWLFLLWEEWLASAVPVFSVCLIASLAPWLATADVPVHASVPVPEPGTEPPSEPRVEPPAEPASEPDRSPADGLLPLAVRGGVLRATADLQYVHLHSVEGVTTVPGPMHRVVALLAEEGLEVRRGEWIADRHVRQVKSVRGQWVVLLKDGQQVKVGRRRLSEVKARWGSTRFA